MLNGFRCLLFALWLSLPTVRAHAGWEGFLRLDTVTTSAATTNYSGWIPVLQVSATGLQRLATNAAPTLQAYGLVKLTDQYSPALAFLSATAASSSKPLTATLDLVNTNLGSLYFRLNLSNVVISTFSQSGGSSADLMQEQVGLVAASVSWNSQVFNAANGLPLTSTETAYSYLTGGATQASSPASFATVGLMGNGDARLSWTATAGVKYQIYAVTSLTQPFMSVGQITATSSGPLYYPIVFNRPAMFYVVQALPAGY